MKKLCPKCKVLLDWVLADPPWYEEYLICPKCDGTYNTEDTKSYLMENKPKKLRHSLEN